jgi:hypothetical protein
MEEAAAFFFFAERWHWTPDQVDDLPVRLYDRLPAVATIHDEITEAEQRKKLDAAKDG